MFAQIAQKALFAAAALAATAVTVSPAVAQTGGTVRTTTVSYADLDLSTDAGVAALNSRVRLAAARVCGVPGSRSQLELADVAQCRAGALDKARRASVTVIAHANSGDRLASDGVVAIGGR